MTRCAWWSLVLFLVLAPLGAAAQGGREVTAARQDLARRLRVSVAEVLVVGERPVTFPDSALGFPRPGEVVARVATEGVALTLQVGPSTYLYTGAAGAVRYGGPRRSWRYSALWLQPVPDEPNLNGNLVQLSLAGTNPEVVLDLVEDYRPMPDGSILATRRTSRSGHELLYLPPGGRRTPKALATAFAFASPTLDALGRNWAAFVRPRVGGPWTLAMNGLDADPAGAAALDVPPGRPCALYWEGKQPVLGMDQDGTVRHFERTDGGWSEIASFADPAETELMMNKSERLALRTEQVDGQPVTRVLSVWFTGDERVLATVPDLEAREMTVSAGFEFVVLSGPERACAVDLSTGEVMDLPAPARLLGLPPAAWSRLEAWFTR